MALNNHVENFTLDMAPGGIAPVLNVSQGDTGRAYTADMYWGGASYDVSGLTVRLRGRKRDNTVFDYALPAPSGTKVAFDLEDKEQITIIPGNVECELVFTDSNSRVVGTADFVIIVEESPYDPNAISESEVTGLVDLIGDQIGGAVDDWMETEAPTSPEFAAAMQDATDTYLDENGVVIDYEDIANKPDFENQFNILNNNEFKYKPLSESATANGWELSGNGYCRQNANAKMVKYVVTGYPFLQLNLSKDNPVTYQFQNAAGVPSSGSTNLVGVPVARDVDEIVEVPTGATHLIVSQNTTNTTNTVNIAEPLNINNRVNFLETFTPIIESGTFVSGGNYDVKQAQANRARNAYKLPVRAFKSITTPEGYNMWYYEYDENGAYLRAGTSWKHTIKSSLLSSDARYINIVIRDTSASGGDLTNLIDTIQSGMVVETAADINYREVVPVIVHRSPVNNPSFEIYRKEQEVYIYGCILLYMPDGVFYILNANEPYNITLTNGQTLVIDTSELTANADINTDTSDCLKVVTYNNYGPECIPVANCRDYEPLFVSAPFSQFVVDLNKNLLKLEQYKENYYPYTAHNFGEGWSNRVNILHISDGHTGGTSEMRNFKEALRVANSIYKDNILSAVVDTGDITNGGQLTKAAWLSQYQAWAATMKTAAPPYLMCLGNHDTNNQSGQALENVPTQAELFDNAFSDIAEKTPAIVWGDATNKKRYCYLDVTQGGRTVRIIMLDMTDHADYTGSNANYHWENVYSQDQIDWLANTALNVPDGYGVIICNHFPIAPNRGSNWSEEWPSADGTFVQGWKLIPEIVDAWQRRTTISKTYNDTVGNQNIVANYNFSSVPSGAVFVCYLVGHLHAKEAYQVKEENGVSFNQLMLCEDSSGRIGVALNRVNKRYGTISDNAFSCLSVDLDEMKVYRTSYGVYKKCSDPTVQRTQVFDILTV